MGLILFLIIFISGCSSNAKKGNLKKVGLLVPQTINDQVWGTKGYKGLLKIQSRYNVDFFYKEGVDSEVLAERTVQEFADKGVNLIFGHGSEYSMYFNRLASKYPDIHFVSFNGNAEVKNTTSLKFESHAMGFFGGMVAAHETKTNKIGVLATHRWQPENKGFVQGAEFENPDVEVDLRYVGNWDDRELALQMLDDMIADGVDVVYPAGDGYNVPVIEYLKERGLHAVGYVSDQSDLGETTVLTSTVQHVDKLYELVASRFVDGTLESGNLYFDFHDGVISMGKFSPNMDEKFQNKVKNLVQEYRQYETLPGTNKGEQK